MNKTIVYNYEFTKEDAVKIYTELIANLGVFNLLNHKSFSLSTTGSKNRTDNANITISGYIKGLTAYISGQIMNSPGNIQSIKMERENMYIPYISRKISITRDGIQTKVSLEGVFGLNKMTRTIDDLFIGSYK